PHSILEAVPDGPLTRDAVKVRALIEDPARTAPLLVTLAEEMPTNESIELAAQLERGSGMRAAGRVGDQVYPDHFPTGSIAARALKALLEDAQDPLVQRARMSAARRTLNERYLARLRRELPLPTTLMPKIFVPQLGPKELEHIAARLGAEIDRR